MAFWFPLTRSWAPPPPLRSKHADVGPSLGRNAERATVTSALRWEGRVPGGHGGEGVARGVGVIVVMIADIEGTNGSDC